MQTPTHTVNQIPNKNNTMSPSPTSLHSYYQKEMIVQPDRTTKKNKKIVTLLCRCQGVLSRYRMSGSANGSNKGSQTLFCYAKGMLVTG